MRPFQFTISVFFFVCLFNVAFIPQLCLNAVEELQNKEVTNNILGEESTSGLNIFEEESKESSKETNEDENNSINLKALGLFRASVYNNLHESLVNIFFHSIHYQSITALNTTPPPKL